MAHTSQPGGSGGAGRAAAVPLAVWPVAQSPAHEQWNGYHRPAGHRAAMGPELARRIVATYAPPGGLVVDPVCGLGVAVVEAARLGRRSVGVATDPRSAAAAETNLRRIVTAARRGRVEIRAADPSGRSVARVLTDLAAQADLVTTCPHPPARGDRHPATPVAVLAACSGVLRPGGVLVVVTRHVHRRGRLIDTAAAAVAAARTVGFVYLEHVIALDAAVADGRLTPTPPRPSGAGMPATAGGRAPTGQPRLHRLVHHDVLVFTKPQVVSRGEGDGG